MQRGPSISLDAVDEGSVVESSPVPHFSAAAFANHTYPVLPSELLIRNANFTVRALPLCLLLCCPLQEASCTYCGWRTVGARSSFCSAQIPRRWRQGLGMSYTCYRKVCKKLGNAIANVPLLLCHNYNTVGGRPVLFAADLCNCKTYDLSLFKPAPNEQQFASHQSALILVACSLLDAQQDLLHGFQVVNTEDQCGGCAVCCGG